MENQLSSVLFIRAPPSRRIDPRRSVSAVSARRPSPPAVSSSLPSSGLHTPGRLLSILAKLHFFLHLLPTQTSNRRVQRAQARSGYAQRLSTAVCRSLRQGSQTSLPSADPSSGGKKTSSDSSASAHLQVYPSPSGWQPPIAGACTHTHTSACTGSIVRVNICQHCCRRRHVRSSHRNTGRAGVCLSLAASNSTAGGGRGGGFLFIFYLINRVVVQSAVQHVRSFKHAFCFF